MLLLSGGTLINSINIPAYVSQHLDGYTQKDKYNLSIKKIFLTKRNAIGIIYTAVFSQQKVSFWQAFQTKGKSQTPEGSMQGPKSVHERTVS